MGIMAFDIVIPAVVEPFPGYWQEWRGLFRNVLNSESPEDIRKLLGQEDYGDENVMGAVLAYDRQGFVINYLGKDVNIEFSPLR